MIPKIIHHIAPEDKNTWHPLWQKCYDSWKEQFPDHKFILWNDKNDIDDLIKTYYKEHWNLYNAFPFHIMRIDFARLCILHKHGGIYADMDVFCYKNFQHILTKEAYFLENLTNEYTDAYVENSLMASVFNNRLLEEILRYIKANYIHFKNVFQTKLDVSSEINANLINNTTGSGMLDVAFNHYKKYFDIDVLNCELFNNRPSSYNKKFYTKHIHTSIWGNAHKKIKLPNIMLLDGLMYNTDIDTIDDVFFENIKQNFNEVLIFPNERFDFFKDYTNGVYLNENNLHQIKKIVSKKH